MKLGLLEAEHEILKAELEVMLLGAWLGIFKERVKKLCDNFFFLRNQLKCCLDMNSSIDIKGQESCLKKDLETLSPLFQSTWQN